MSGIKSLLVSNAQKNSINTLIARTDFITIGYYLLTFLYLISSIQIIGALSLVLFFIMLVQGKGYLSVPILIVFSDHLYIPFLSGMGLYKYAILILLLWDILCKRVRVVSFSRMIQCLIVVLFILATLIEPKGLSIMVYAPVVIYFALLCGKLRENDDMMKQFGTALVFSMLFSLAFGIIFNRFATEVSVIGNNNMDLSRFFASFVDPNYAGFFFNAAIAVCLCLKPFRILARFACIIPLYIGLIMTASITGIICNVAMLLILFFIKNGLHAKTLLIILLISATIVALYAYGLNSSITFLNQICTRIDLKLQVLLDGEDLQAFTSGRTSLTAEHWRYLKENGKWFHWMFGGIPSTALYVIPTLARVAHLEYVDIILNIGIIGAMLYLIAILSRALSALFTYLNDKREISLFSSLIYLNYLVYGLSISIFMEPLFFLWALF